METNFGEPKTADFTQLIELTPEQKDELIVTLRAEVASLESENASLKSKAVKKDGDDARSRRGGKDEGYVVRERQDRIVKVRHSSVVFRRDELIVDPAKLALAREHGINLKRYTD